MWVISYWANWLRNDGSKTVVGWCTIFVWLATSCTTMGAWGGAQMGYQSECRWWEQIKVTNAGKQSVWQRGEMFQKPYIVFNICWETQRFWLQAGLAISLYISSFTWFTQKHWVLNLSGKTVPRTSNKTEYLFTSWQRCLVPQAKQLIFPLMIS